MGKISIGLLAMAILGSACLAFGQTPTVTNADLEKFRQMRLAAERDLAENYEALGFPSPEERLAAEARSGAERARIVAELYRRDAERARQEYEAAVASDVPQAAFPYPNPNFVDYGGRYAPAHFYYRTYYPGYPPYWRNYTKEPPRFRTFRRMWRDATRGATRRVPGRRQ